MATAWVPTSSQGSGGGGSGTVTSVASADTSIVVTNPTTTPSLQLAALNVLATNEPPAAAVPLNAKKITGLADGTAATDAAAFGQIPAALPPSGAAGGDLTGSTYPNPTVAAAKITTAKLAAAVTLDAIATANPTAASIPMNTQKLTGLAAGTTNGDSARFEQLATAGPITSVFARTGVVAATSGDYTAAQVTNAADKNSASQQTFTGNVSTPALLAAGLTGATAATRYVGATTSGPPASGTFAVGDFVIDQTGKVLVCTVAGTPGTWLSAPPGWSSTFDLVNSTTTTSVLNQSIPANTLGANGAIHCVIEGFYLNNSGASRGLSLGVTFGVTNLWFDTSSATYFASTATVYPFYMEFLMANEGATNAQRVSGIVLMGNTNAAGTIGTGTITGGVTVDACFTGTSAIDTTAAASLAVKMKLSAADANLEIKGSAHARIVP